jgi:protein ImuB
MHQERSAETRQVHFAALMHPTLILHARDPRRGLVVVAASDAATASGIRLGMPLAEAMTLAGKVPSSKFQVQGPETLNLEPGTLNCIAHDPAADLAELACLAEHCERFSPLVGWNTVEAEVQGSKFKVQSQQSPTLNFEPGTWNSLFLDITGIGVLFGGEEQLAREALADLARLGYAARAAVADTIGAAWAASQFKVQGSKFKVLHSSTLNFELGTWNLGALRLPQETLDLLAQLGITRLAELLALPRASLRARFGELLLRLDQLTGAAQEVIVPYRPPPKFAAEWVLEYPAERRDVIEQIARELVARVAVALAERREGVVRLSCRLDCGRTDFQSVPDGMQFSTTVPDGMQFRPTGPARLDVGLFRPSADARHLWDLVRMQLEQLVLPGPVGRVTLQALSTAPLENRQGELFAGGKDEADRQLALLIDRLASRLGPDAVLRPELTADPLPEKSSKYVSTIQTGKFKVQSSKFKVSKAASTLNFEPGTLNSCFRPLFLRPPFELDVVSVVPDGPPVTFRYAGRIHRVAWHWGPERIETGWFRGTSVRRDYYRVETDEGLRFWLFRRLGDEKWCLHGEFS